MKDEGRFLHAALEAMRAVRHGHYPRALLMFAGGMLDGVYRNNWPPPDFDEIERRLAPLLSALEDVLVRHRIVSASGTAVLEKTGTGAVIYLGSIEAVEALREVLIRAPTTDGPGAEALMALLVQLEHDKAE